MKTYIFLTLSFIFLTAFSCKKEETLQTATISTIVGKWKLTGIFLGDALDRPCNVNTPERDIILELTDNQLDNSNFMKLTGQSVVNNYFGSYEAKSDGTIKITQIGSTKKGGSPEMMQCEAGYYEHLAMTEAYKFFVLDGRIILQLGRFKKDDSPSRDGGTYLIFEKI
jgi:hypothetical protein